MTEQSKGPGTALLPVAWGAATAVVLFTAENIWLDRLLRSRWQGFPSLLPEVGSTGWIVAFAVMALGCVLLVVCEIFVLRDESVVPLKKWGTVGLSLLALVLFGIWTWSTGTESSAASQSVPQKEHTVTLRWKASTSKVDGYNVYRSESPGGPFERINADLVKDTTFLDPDAKSGVTYYYAVRSVVGKVESKDSNHAEAAVPVP